jgi:TetR/AcrR family transcriptional regulator
MSTRPWPAERKPSQRAILGTSPQRSYKSREERRMEIVQATLAIIAEDGLHAWTTSALAQRVGVAEATLFRHFASKDEILSSAVTHQSETLRQRVMDYRGQGTAWEELLGLVADVLAFFEETGGSPILILSGQATRISSDSRKVADATRDLLRWRLMQIFRRAGCSDTDRLLRPELLADMALAVIHSTGLRWLMSGQQYPMQCQAAQMLSVLRRCME